MIEPYFETDNGKLYHGDCLEIMREMEPDSVDLIVTSPPYNMRTRIRNGEYVEREQTSSFSKKYQYFHDAYTIGKYYKIHRNALLEMMRLSGVVFWNIQLVTGSKEAVFKLIGTFAKNIKDIIIWDKGFGQPAMQESVLNRASEYIIIFESKGTAGRQFANSFFKRGTMSDIWRLGRGESLKTHGACFPFKLVGNIITNWSIKKAVIMDPFFGSGTTAIACERLNRRWIGIEISKEYCDIAVKRIKIETAQHKLEF